MSEKIEAKPDLVKKLDAQVLSVIKAEKIEGFEMAFKIASAIQELKDLLTPEYMKPIMAMQNNKLGFKTDKADSGYPEATVKNCLIEAVLTGVQPFGNQFNIIAGNCYITKEGFGYLLDHFKGLKYEIIPSLPRINENKTSAAIVMKINWEIGSIKESREIDFPIRMNSFMGVDAVIGKATRKARAWLFNSISGFEIADGDVMDVDGIEVGSKKNIQEKVSNIYDDKEGTKPEATKKDLFDTKDTKKK